jgi:glycosyltransferase involved in cell wall biosynthesis
MKVSIITPVYNSFSTLNSTFNSIAKQNYRNLEHIVIDGGSNDGSIELIKDKSSSISYWSTESDLGIYDAINKGLKVATGDIIGILNSNDRFYDTNSLDKIVKIFQDNHTIDCVYGNLIFVNNEGQIKRKWQSRPFIKGLFEKSWTPAHPTFYCRKKVYDKQGFYKINYRIASDVEFMFRAIELNNFKSYHINEYLIEMNLGGISNKGFNSTFLIIHEILKAFKENGKKLNLIKYIFYKLLKIRELFT